MKKALWPILWMLLAIGLLATAAYLYEQKWGLDGPFPAEGHHW